MNKFYVRDGSLVKYFTVMSDVIRFLELVVNEKLKMNRRDWTQHMVDLGHGNDDRSFVDSMQPHVEIGCVQSNGKHVRCNIFEAVIFRKPEYGD